jgi:hypothetical protein
VVKWSKVNIARISELTTRKESIQGVGVQTWLSPYDMPEAIGIDDHAIIIKYMGSDEPMVSRQVDGTTSIKIGKNSKRLYRIDTLNLDESKLNSVLQFLDDMPKSRREKHRDRLPYYVALKVAIMAHVLGSYYGT